MNYHDLDEFKSAIDLLERFFTDFAAREDEVLTLGMRRVAKWESYKQVTQLLKDFETKVHEFEVFLRPIDKLLFERVRTLTTESKLVESITGIEVSLRIDAQRQKLSLRSELINILLFQLPYISNSIRKRKLFSEEVIPIQKLIVALGRLNHLVSISKDTYIKQWSRDSDVFKPANLDNEKIITLIEAAIKEIESISPLSKDDKRQLIEYLYKAKSEFSENSPSWSKIVGALVIAAAITSGIADAPGAFKNIDTAIQYIIGTSIEKHIPKQVPLLMLKNPEPEIEEIETTEVLRV
ncbi:MAG: hypothetical protein Q7T53_10340 [Deltaproteobacteria bacterium]|nr:hypothetical protein [Deltaproteobacteria bacterium]